MTRRAGWIVVLVAALGIVGVRVVLLWGSHGGVVDLVRGQWPAAPRTLNAGISARGGSGEPNRVRVTVDRSRSVAEVAPEFLSLAIDASQVTGGKWWNPAASGRELGSGSMHAPRFDFNRPPLDVLVAGLTPAYLRIGGSESDKVFYDMQPAGATPRAPPAGYESVLPLEQWNALTAFAARHALPVVFTLNAGPSRRTAAGAWDASNAEALLCGPAHLGASVRVWELGNEVNNFWFVFGPRHQTSTAQYHDDLSRARALVARCTPSARLGGQGSMFWPVLGEPLSLYAGFMPAYLAQSGGIVDQVSWHYYPQQSRRGPVASRRAHPSRLLDPDALDEAAYWAGKMRAWRDMYAPGKPLWLGETGNAQFGGEPGLSDAYLASLWWMDELGLMARTGMDVVVRQTLSGMNYGLLDDATLAPRPDYWASLLWKRLMGQHVHAASVTGDDARRVRAYAHATDSTLTVLLVNLDPVRDATVRMPSLDGQPFTEYAVTAPDLFGQSLLLNDAPLSLTAAGALPVTAGRDRAASASAMVTVHPVSYSFVTARLR